MSIVITGCTNRKRKPVPDALHMSSLSEGTLTSLAADWGRRLANEAGRFPAWEIYGGRAFQEAAAGARGQGARLLVVSAGLGLIEASTAIPAYACTVLIGARDSVGERVHGAFSPFAWWSSLQAVSPFATPLAEAIAGQSGPILIALSDTYLAMVANDLLALPLTELARVRIFTRAPKARVAEALRPLVMPYDDRLDGPDSSIRGTRSDFAARALRHFVGLRLPSGGSSSEDAEAVGAALADWNVASRINRVRHDDTALLALIREQWDAAAGSSARLLRLFRDELGVACEQARFAALARQVREERA